ncbi:MAG: hypothetical protein ACM3KJ_10650, partial [Bacillota bacterium]
CRLLSANQSQTGATSTAGSPSKQGLSTSTSKLPLSPGCSVDGSTEASSFKQAFITVTCFY